jgi:hypothetical protein
LAVIIGNATTVSITLAGSPVNEGITSVDWSKGGQPNKLWTLGSRSPYAAIIPAQNTVSFSVYGDITPSISLEITISQAEPCPESPAKGIINITPAICGTSATIEPFSSEFYVTSYSYTKDRTNQGVETWQGNSYLLADVAGYSGKVYAEPLPSVLAMGTAEGTLVGDDTQANLETTTGAIVAADSITTEGEKGNVQAQALSIGEYDTTYFGTFSYVGHSRFWAPGVKASANVTITLQPIYLPE